MKSNGNLYDVHAFSAWRQRRATAGIHGNVPVSTVERLKFTLSELDEDNMSENVNASSAALESRIKALEKQVTALEEKTKSL